jgi:nucleoside-diphosphate-sugar epimerase
VAAEKLLRRYAQRQQCSVAILRAPGIYAADRLPLARIERQDPVLNAAEDVYTNHIHAEDLAKLCCIALFRGQAGRVYHASDDNQLKMGDYFDAVADHFGYPRPPRLTRAAAAEQLSPLTLSFMSESRRLKNQRIKKELRVQLRYPQLCFESPENGG